MSIAASSPRWLLAALGLVALAACSHDVNENDVTPQLHASDSSLTIMTFNVENLFQRFNFGRVDSNEIFRCGHTQQHSHRQRLSKANVLT